MKYASLFALVIAIAAAEEWAVLLAGSSGYGNYRHQSDVAHMYGVLTDHHYNPDHIITFMYGDLPEAKYNPFPGTIFNHPGNDQRNYNDGVVIDYDQSVKMTAELYLAVLLGQQEKVDELTGRTGNKVLKSTAEDTVFLYYIDHGGDNIVAMPSGPYLTAKMLVDTLTEMHEKKMFKKAVYYLEACESGSMWQKLPTDIDVYALSSTHPSESSWGTYCPPDDVVDGKHIGSCLGEVWSCFWLEQDDTADLTKLTLQKQFDDAKEFTKTSHPLQFGDMTMANDVLSEYISGEEASRKFLRVDNKRMSSWNSRDNELLYWKNRALNENDKEAKDMYIKIAERNLNTDRYFAKLVKKVMGNDDLLLNTVISEKNWPCYNAVLDKYQSTYGFDEYSLKYSRTLANMCSLYKGETKDIVNAL